MKIIRPIESGQCSYYEYVKRKRNQKITVAQFINAIRSNRWKAKVEKFRRLKAEGLLKEAEAIKSKMPAVIIAAVCEGGHSKEDVRTLSGYLMLDIDHYPGDIHELKKLLQALPWVMGVWISISGDGMKLIVRVDCTTQEEYEKLAYPIVARYISQLINFPVDMRCSDLSRTCFASYDPEAFLREGECEVFPWREEVETFLAEQQEKEAAEKEGKTSADEAGTASGLVQKFFDQFIERHPYVRNYRHDFQLRLGREARRKGMNESEFEQLVSLAVSKLSMPDCDGPEITRNLTDAYRFAELNKLEEYPRVGFKGSKVSPEPYLRDNDGVLSLEEMVAHNYEMRLEAPYIPDWVYDQLPEMLREGLKVSKSRRQRDMLFLAMLANYSGCMPQTYMVYDNTVIYPHLFVDVIGSAASGKGIMMDASQLGMPIHEMFCKENKEKQQRYEEALFVWEEERKRALKEKRNPDEKLRPEPVRRKVLIIPADTSRTQLIQQMSSSPDGLIINISEMDTLRTATSAEYGKFDDLMRACYHHEKFGSNFKGDNQEFIVHCPKMAFCASGTPSQFYKLCPSLENGAYSRYLIYMAEQETGFRNMAPDGEKMNRKTVFLNLSGKTLEMYRFLKEYPTEVKFTSDQWCWHQAFFEDMLQKVRLEETEGPNSIIFRHGMSAARLAMILTTLRKFEAQWKFHEMTCTDEDFRLAMAIIEVLLHHSLMLSTTLRKEVGSPNKMRNYFQVKEALETLPAEFPYNELMEALVSTGLSLSSAKRIRKRLLEQQIIEQEKDSYRFKSRKWRENLKKGFRK